MNKLTAIVLTYNEEIHIERCVKSLHQITNKIIIVDSQSKDKTLEICKELEVQVYQNSFVNQAQQFNWALENCDISTDWVIRLDADEYLTDELAKEIIPALNSAPENTTGFYLKRRVYFMGKWIKYGGYYPTKLLRIWKRNCGKYENRWMDEHVILEVGEAAELKFDFIDDNLNNMTWWTNKHNSYATREAIDILNAKYKLMESDSINKLGKSQSEIKRKYKEGIYLTLPLFFRAFIYFNFRYFILFGFLDGKKGFIWHFLQGFWYRFLVDAKIYDIERKAIGNVNNFNSLIKDQINVYRNL